MTPRSLSIVLHGKQASNRGVRDAVTSIRNAGHHVDVRVTWEAGDAGRFVREALQRGVDTVVAGGGDGTINEVASALVEAGTEASSVALGILPLGTANDFANSTSIPLDPLGALLLIIDAPVTSIDIGRIGARSFINVATGGFGTKVTVETPQELKRVLGGAAYFITGMRRFSSIRSESARFHAPDFDWEGSFLVLALGNGRQAGGGHVLCPEAQLNDGLLDLSILPQVDPSEVSTALSNLMRQGIAAAEQAVIRAKVPWIEIHSETPLCINLDGEPISGTEFRFEAIPAALRVHLPKSPLLR